MKKGDSSLFIRHCAPSLNAKNVLRLAILAKFLVRSATCNSLTL